MRCRSRSGPLEAEPLNHTEPVSQSGQVDPLPCRVLLQPAHELITSVVGSRAGAGVTDQILHSGGFARVRQLVCGAW